ncbi:MAG: hypothetical protein U0746_10815 [Gemmataceae bacterium]
MLSLRTLALTGLSAVGLTTGAARADWYHDHHHLDHYRPVVHYRPVCPPPAPCPPPVVSYRSVCPPPIVAVPPPPCGPVVRPSFFRASVAVGPLDIHIGGCR